MTELLASLLVFGLAMAGLGLGLLLGRGAIQGSCGGLANLPGVGSDCGGACRRPCRKRRGQHNGQVAPDRAGHGTKCNSDTDHGRGSCLQQ